MSNKISFLTLAAIIGLSLAATGCNDQLKAKDAQISLIEDANLRLSQDLAAARRDKQDLMLRQDELNNRVLAFQGQVDDLNTQLAAKPEPAVSDGWQAVPGGAMIAIEGSVLFAPGKPTLRPAGKTTLDGIASTLRSQYADKDILVFGHTDDSPIKKSGWKDNFELSAQRALTVVRYLQQHGVNPAKLVACGAGEHRPVASNSSETDKARNRRVEIFAVNPINR